MSSIKVTNEMMQCVKDNIYLVINESTGRASVSVGGDWESICRRIIGLHQNTVNQHLDKLNISGQEIPKSYTNQLRGEK